MNLNKETNTTKKKKKKKILQNLLYKSYILMHQFLNPTQKSDYNLFIMFKNETKISSSSFFFFFFIFDWPKYEQKNFTI